MDCMTLKRPALSLSQARMGDLDISSPFFASFVSSYLPYYYEWFEKKHNDKVLIVSEDYNIRGLLKLKLENPDEDYSDISPIFEPLKRLKICSLKVEPNDADISSIFMRTTIATAIARNVDEIYATITSDSDYKIKLLNYLHKWGFRRVGQKFSYGLLEDVVALRTSAISDSIVKSVIDEYNSSSDKKGLLRYDF